jgi:predicted RNA-binding protein with PIN domain
VPTVLVDGENVRRSVWPNIERGDLEQRSRAWGQAHGHEVVVVWEGAETADDRIAAEVRQLAPPLWVVTSDRRLRERVAAHADRIVGGGSFARELGARYGSQP